MKAEQHFRPADKAAAKAAELLGQADSQAAAVWATLAQVHATLALAAAVGRDASGREGPVPCRAPPGPSLAGRDRSCPAAPCRSRLTALGTPLTTG
jgi:hypothetical protein